jgi:hypothetical protein
MRFFTAFGETLGMIWLNRGPLFWVAASGVLALGFLFFYYASPATRIGPVQPIPFSHRVHAGHKNIDCRFCHSYVDRSLNPGMPPVEKCLFCHKYIIANHPEIQKEHNFFNSNIPTPWVKVHPARTRGVQPRAAYQKGYRLCNLSRGCPQHGPPEGQTLPNGLLHPVPPGQECQCRLLAGLPQLIVNFELWI